MSRWQITLWNKRSRERVIEEIMNAKNGTRVQLLETKRTVPQNDRMWAMLTCISDQLLWHGQHYTSDDWKDYFMHELNNGRWMPAEGGGMVPIGRSTSNLGKQEHSLLTELIEAFAERNGVDLMEQQHRTAENEPA